MDDIENSTPDDGTVEAPAWPPYEPPPDAVIFSDVELVDPDGTPFTVIIASAYFADYYCAYVMPGWTWRHYVPPEPAPEAEDPPAEPEPVDGQ